MALAFTSGLLVLGAIFNTFGLMSFLFGFDHSAAFTFWLIGTGLWLLALALFAAFMTRPQPRHSFDRYAFRKAKDSDQEPESW